MKFLNLFNANLRKEFIQLKRYWPNTLAIFLTYYFIFLMGFLGIKFVGNPVNVDSNIQYTIVSVVFWALTVKTMNFIGFDVIREGMHGTLEQLYMSPMGVWKIFLNRIVAQFFLQSIIMTILLFAAMLTSRQWLNLNPMTTVPIIILTMISMIGVSFMIAGLAIIVKQIQALLQIFQFILMALVFIPLSLAPFLVFAPFVKGLNMIRTVMTEDLSFGYLSWVDYGILMINSGLYLVIGLLVFQLCEKLARKKGLLSQY